MSSSARNLVNLQDVHVAYGAREVLAGVSLGVSNNQRIGVVGRNGDGKSTLVRLLAGLQEPDRGRATLTRGLQVVTLDQADRLDSASSIGEVLAAAAGADEWAREGRLREIVDGLLGTPGNRFSDGLDTRIGALSGGERRRVDLARALLEAPDLLILDEPTNHLDVEAVHWLAGHLSSWRGALVVGTHDRWFLDAVVEQTWEVVDRTVHSYEGGYAAFVLAKAERERVEAIHEHRRRNLLRKELAWLRRGPPARTSKPRFRIEAASALIADEPPARDTAELVRFATARLGKRVVDVEDAGVSIAGRRVLRDVTWRLGPGDRVALVGANGSGKTTLLRLINGDLDPEAGSVERGATVRCAVLDQHLDEIDPDLRVLDALEEVRRRTTLPDGREVTAGMLCERFGFRGPRAGTPVRDLSGGERRRLQLMRLLMAEPNVLLLDEPTNDLDIETLTAFEDLLDEWAGTLIVVSHDRYFVERVCDDVYTLDTEGGIRHLPGGVDQYLDERAAPTSAPSRSVPQKVRPRGSEIRETRKRMERLERDMERTTSRIGDLDVAMAEAATEPERLRELADDATRLRGVHAAAEEEWLELAELLEGGLR